MKNIDSVWSGFFRQGLSALLLIPFLLTVLYPFLWMVFGIFKTNREFFQPLRLWPMDPLNWEYWKELSRTFFPSEFNLKNIQELFDGKWVPYWDVFMNSMVSSLGQALGAVALSAMTGYAFTKYQFRWKNLCFVLVIAVILIPRQLFAVPIFSWLNTLGLNDSLFGIMLPGIITGLGVIYFTQVFRKVPEEYIQVARTCGASEFRIFLMLLSLIWPAVFSYSMIHFILAWHEHLIPMLVLTSDSQQTLPLALTKLYDVSQRTPQGVQMAASTFSLIPTAILFAFCHRKFKSSLSDMLVH